MRLPQRQPTTDTFAASDGVPLHVRVWEPARSTELGVLYLHGIQSHGGWFEHSAAVIADHGPLVALPDRRGSGQSGGPRGDTPSVACWLADLDDVTAHLGDRYNIRCWALVGVSWGGKIAVAWAQQRPERSTALLLIAPGLCPQVDVALTTKLSIAWSLLTRPQRPFQIPLSDPALFTDNPAGQAFIAADPLKLTHATARFLFQSRRLDGQLAKLPSGVVTAPLTLLLGERDQIIDNARTRRLLGRVCAKPPATQVLSMAAHTLEFAADPADFLGAVSEWSRGLTRC